ncbi:MAG: TolC family protein [Bacteroidota bacterium]
MKQIKLLLILLFGITQIFGQQIMLKECFLEAEKNYPLLIQQDLWQQSFAETNSILDKNWLPQVDLNAQATYQSDVTVVSIPFPNINIPTPEKDQYKATLDIKQLIWDGGSIGKEKGVKKIENNIEKQKISIDLFKLKERIAQIYFRVLLTDESINLTKMMIEDLNTRLKTIESGIKNGVVLQSSADRLKVEILRQQQRITELQTDRNTNVTALNTLLGTNYASEAKLIIPEIAITITNIQLRPELQLYELQQQQFSAKMKTVSTKNLPKLSAFAQGGYGRPGLNMFDLDFQFFYIAGLRLNWSLWNWNNGSNEKKMYSIAGQLVDKQKEIFARNTNLQLQQQQAEMTKAETLLKTDDEIITIQTSLKVTASKQFENGTISANDYLNELNAELISKLNKKIHEIQLVMSKINYQFATGNITF